MRANISSAKYLVKKIQGMLDKGIEFNETVLEEMGFDSLTRCTLCRSAKKLRDKISPNDHMCRFCVLDNSGGNYYPCTDTVAYTNLMMYPCNKDVQDGINFLKEVIKHHS